eukprot:1255786-Pyramimonas_sp.AAC.1
MCIRDSCKPADQRGRCCNCWSPVATAARLAVRRRLAVMLRQASLLRYSGKDSPRASASR